MTEEQITILKELFDKFLCVENTEENKQRRDNYRSELLAFLHGCLTGIEND